MSYAPEYLRRNYLTKGDLKKKWKMETKKVLLNTEEQTKCLSVLEDESGLFFLYALKKRIPDEVRGEDNDSRDEESDRILFFENPIFRSEKK